MSNKPRCQYLCVIDRKSFVSQVIRKSCPWYYQDLYPCMSQDRTQMIRVDGQEFAICGKHYFIPGELPAAIFHPVPLVLHQTLLFGEDDGYVYRLYPLSVTWTAVMGKELWKFKPNPSFDYQEDYLDDQENYARTLEIPEDEDSDIEV